MKMYQLKSLQLTKVDPFVHRKRLIATNCDDGG